MMILYKGLFAQRPLEITEDVLSTYKNQGGFDLLGRTVDQIRTTEQVNATRAACLALKLDGLVIVGGVTSNTYAAQLAETFAEAKCLTKVVGVPVTLYGDLKNQFVEMDVGFDTICRVNSQLISNVCSDALSTEKGQAKDYTNMKKKPSPVTMVKSPLKREIQQLEKRLKDQLSVRYALERAMGYKPSAIDSSGNSSMPKPTKELIREIAVLEVEVMYLEQYLLSLYRKTFDQQICTVSSITSVRDTSLSQNNFRKGLELNNSSKRKNTVAQPSQILMPRSPAMSPVDDICQEITAGPCVHRRQSALSRRAVYLSRISPSEESLARALQT